MHSTRRHILARLLARHPRLIDREPHILKRNIIARLYHRARHGSLRAPHRPARKIHKRHVGNLHLRRSQKRAIVPIVLRNGRPGVRALDDKVLEAHVLHYAPAAASRLTRGLVRGLRDLDADPGFDVGGIVQVVVVALHGDVGEEEVLHGGVF